jgi:DNA-directed RNA polymerase subunit F
MNSPSERLAVKILKKLLQEKLLSAPEAKKILSKLAEGKVSVEDWRLAIELSMPWKTKP